MRLWLLSILLVGVLACTGGRVSEEEADSRIATAAALALTKVPTPKVGPTPIPTPSTTPGMVPPSTEERSSLSLVANPTVVGTLVGLPDVTDVFVAGDLAFVTDRQSGGWIVDVSDSTGPVLVRPFDSVSFASGDLAYITAGDGPHIWDVFDPSNPKGVGFADMPGAREVFVSGSLAYVAGSRSGLHIVDVSRASVPVKVGSLDTPGFAQDVVVSGNLAFVADGYSACGSWTYQPVGSTGVGVPGHL